MTQSHHKRNTEVKQLLDLNSPQQIALRKSKFAKNGINTLLLFALVHLFKVQDTSRCNQERQTKETNNEHNQSHIITLVIFELNLGEARSFQLLLLIYGIRLFSLPLV
ncbi:hypothetical protein D3C76_1397680 [compost metagenome]